MIKNNLSTIMGKKRIKMSSLARTTGISKNSIFNIYHEKTSGIEYKVLNKLCKALECQPGDLLEYIEDKGKE